MTLPASSREASPCVSAWGLVFSGFRAGGGALLCRPVFLERRKKMKSTEEFIIAKAINLPNKAIGDIVQALLTELQDREIRNRINPDYTNEELFEDALTMGLTPDDPDVIAGGYSKEFGEYIAQKERKESMRTTGA